MSRAQPSGLAALLDDYRQFAGSALWLALLLILLGSLAEGFGLLMIVPLASIAIGDRTGDLSRFVEWSSAWSSDQRFLAALALFLTAMAARSVLLYARDVRVARLQAGYEASLRLRSAATLARRGWPFASRIGQGGMQALLLSDVPRAALAISYVQQFVISSVMLAVLLVVTAFLSPVLTALALVLMAAGGIVARRWVRRGTQSGMAISKRTERSVSSGFHFHAGLKAALAQGTVRAFLHEYRSSLAAMTRETVRFSRDHAGGQQVAGFGAAIAAALLLFVGFRLLALPFAVLIASLILFARVSGPAQVLLRAAQQIAAFAPSFEAIEERLGLLNATPPDEDTAEPLDWAELRAESVALEHGPGLGLKSASFALRAGEWTGISGASGAGKTTLVDLVAGLLTPVHGKLVVDGRELGGTTLEQWRAGLAYVGQEATLFDDSVRGNLLAEGAEADDAALWHMLETVGLAARIRALPAGLDENVGDRGSQLSGGEQQRLVLARALLRKPRLIILDEATAALDSDSEAALLGKLRSATPRPAALVIAHRDSTLAHCDSVIAIQHGRLNA